MNRHVVLAFSFIFTLVPVRAQDALDRLDETLTVSAAHDQFRARLSGTLDLEFYAFNLPAPGLINSTSETLFNPRLTLFLDSQLGPAFYFFVQAPGCHAINAFRNSDISFPCPEQAHVYLLVCAGLCQGAFKLNRPAFPACFTGLDFLCSVADDSPHGGRIAVQLEQFSAPGIRGLDFTARVEKDEIEPPGHFVEDYSAL
jgi:hypothetical protein